MHEAVGAVAEKTYVDVFDTDVTVDDASDDDGRDGDTPCYFGDDGAGAVERWAGHLIAGEVVDDHGGDQIHRDVADLEECQGLGEVARILELGDEGEEGWVAGVGEDHV